MTFEVVNFDGSNGRLFINTDIGQFWRDFALGPEETVYFDNLDTLVDEGITEANHTMVSTLEAQDFTDIVLSDLQVQEQLAEDRYFSVECHGNFNDYYGVSIYD